VVRPLARLISSPRRVNLPIDDIREVHAEMSATEQVFDEHRQRY
jgi:hypothetical protein